MAQQEPDETNFPPRNHWSLSGVVLVGRFIVGASISVSAVADVSYLAEVAPRTLRGSMVSCNELAISIGILAAFFAGHVFQDVHGEFCVDYAA